VSKVSLITCLVSCNAFGEFNHVIFQSLTWAEFQRVR
jgi:hypothetical protein